jgi:hypothetical protein
VGTVKRQKLRALVRDVLAEGRMYESPVTFDTLSVRFDERLVTFRGRKIEVEAASIDIPLLSTDRLILTNSGEVV